MNNKHLCYTAYVVFQYYLLVSVLECIYHSSRSTLRLHVALLCRNLTIKFGSQCFQAPSYVMLDAQTIANHLSQKMKAEVRQHIHTRNHSSTYVVLLPSCVLACLDIISHACACWVGDDV